MIIAILLIDAGMQSVHLSNQTSVVALDASAINRVNTVYMTIYFLGGSTGTFVSGLFWQHYGWTGVVGVGVAFTAASLLVNCFNFSHGRRYHTGSRKLNNSDRDNGIR
jgi:predicted MFS family arabinose efflux permease